MSREWHSQKTRIVIHPLYRQPQVAWWAWPLVIEVVLLAVIALWLFL